MPIQGSMPKLFLYYMTGGFSLFITILHGGVFPIYYNITIGGEGSTGTPNLYYVINERPLMDHDVTEDALIVKRFCHHEHHVHDHGHSRHHHGL